uniref:Uncharacterized protein n=1 Tax=Aegilops tauschii TaxID=37682 RepID=M8BBF7_AEGTA
MAVTPNLPLLLLATSLLLAAAPLPSAAEKFVVGDKKNWAPNVNYTTWPDQYHFHVGDWLQFNYAKGMYDVVQVANQTAYDKCDPSNPLVSYDRGRGFGFPLNSPGCYCWSGMKVTVLVEDSPAQPPHAAAPSPNAAARHGVVSWAVAAAAASLCAAVLGLPFAV